MTTKFKEISATAWVALVLLIALITMACYDSAFGKAGLVWYGAGCAILYFVGILFCVQKLTPSREVFGKHTNEIGAILLAIVWPALFILLFGIGWDSFGKQYLFASTPAGIEHIGSAYSVNAFYLSTITFTSTGYGDLVPSSAYARGYASIEAFLGHVHAVAFFAILFSQVDSWKKKSGP